jgi:DNA-binding FadR family transcriptional regulator
MARLHRDVMQVLIREIVTARRPPGELLPREVDLSEQFGVSRGVARETIRAMEERGLVDVKHGKGATVNAADRWSAFDPDVLAVLLEGPEGNEILAQYLECRRILEVEAAGLAAQRASRAELRDAAAALARMERWADESPSRRGEELFHEADLAFHGALIAATGNRALGGLVERLHGALMIARHALARPGFRVERALPAHRRIYDAVAAREPEEARAAMREHLDTVASYLSEQVAAAR